MVNITPLQFIAYFLPFETNWKLHDNRFSLQLLDAVTKALKKYILLLKLELIYNLLMTFNRT